MIDPRDELLPFTLQFQLPSSLPADSVHNFAPFAKCPRSLEPISYFSVT